MSDEKQHDELSDDEKAKLERRLTQRMKTAGFNRRMEQEGYKRKSIWLSIESQERLAKLSRNTSQEKAIEEALQVAVMVADMYPDGSILEKADRLKARLRAIPRFDEFGVGEDRCLRDEADSLMRQRIAKVAPSIKKG